MMGGELTADSRRGHGSTFRFSARLGAGRRPRASRRSRVALPENLRVLVVDDNATNRAIVTAYLSARVTVCDQAESGPAALDACSRPPRATACRTRSSSSTTRCPR